MLTEQQDRMKTTEDPNVLCLASAGSGKSFTLIHRITYLIKEKGVAPEQITLFSFSRTATQEIRDKLVEALGKETFDRLTVSTFHAYAYRIIREQAHVFRIDNSKLKIMSTQEVEGLLKYTSKIFYDRDKISGEFKKADLQIIMEAYSDARHDKNFSDLVNNDYKTVLKDVLEYMDRKSLYTFDDLLKMTEDLFRKYPRIAMHYGAHFKYIILDEAQDTSKYVFNILRLLLNEHHHFMGVGDIQQNLYGFTGCDPDNLIAFAEFRNCEIYQLNKTFRFGPTISNSANDVVAEMTIPDEYKIITETEQLSEPITFTEVSTGNHLNTALAHIQQWYRAGVPYKDMYILARTNRELMEYFSTLTSHNIPATNRGESLMNRKEIRFIISALALIRANSREDWVEFVKPLPVGINTKIVNLVFREFDGSLEAMFQYLSDTHIQGIGQKRKGEFYGLITQLLEVKRLIAENVRDFGVFAQTLHLDDTEFMKTTRMNAEGQSITEERWDFIRMLTQMAEGFSGDILSFPEFLKTNFDVDQDPNKEAVTLLTIHKSKGMTLPYTVLDTKKFYSFTNSEQEILWEKFCLYVGITRAKNKLVFLYNGQNPASSIVPGHEYLSPDEVIAAHEEGKLEVTESGKSVARRISAFASKTTGGRQIFPSRLLNATEKAVQLEIRGRALWIPKKSLYFNPMTEAVHVADWYARQENL